MTDPIVDEVRRVRDAYAARFNHDLQAMFLDIKERERQSGIVFVNGAGRLPETDREAHPAVSGSSPGR
jgi:hypothetical protein